MIQKVGEKVYLRLNTTEFEVLLRSNRNVPNKIIKRTTWTNPVTLNRTENWRLTSYGKDLKLIRVAEIFYPINEDDNFWCRDLIVERRLSMDPSKINHSQQRPLKVPLHRRPESCKRMYSAASQHASNGDRATEGLLIESFWKFSSVSRILTALGCIVITILPVMCRPRWHANF